MEYHDFIRQKQPRALSVGFSVPKSDMNPKLFTWQKDIVHWALRKGRAALFEDCGLGKTVQQLEWARHVSNHTGRPVLIVAPLTVTYQTAGEGKKFGYQVRVCRGQDDVGPGINTCNYEMLGHFDPPAFGGVVLDESSILKDYAGSLRNEITEMFKDTPYRLSCTATPSPNDTMELGNQAEFLGVMSRGEMLSTFFTHDGGSTSHWRLKGHGEESFWAWVAGWAVVLTTPADLGYGAAGYRLPPKATVEHIVHVSPQGAGGNLSFFAKEAKTLTERRDARKCSLRERCEEAAKIVRAEPDEQWVIWCDLNSESGLLEQLIPGAQEVKGSDPPEIKAKRLSAFTNGSLRYLVTKPSIAGFGLNWQGCARMVFVGLSDSFEKMYQATRRCWRFGQERQVQVHIVTSEAEGAVRENIARKERQAQEMVREMVAHTREILRGEIQGTVRQADPYDPKVEMALPLWVRRTA